MDAIRKLLSDIKAKDNENFKYELEKNKLEEDVKESEERIGKKIKILEKHLQQKCKYGEYLKKQIENLNKTKDHLNEKENILDMVCIIRVFC